MDLDVATGERPTRRITVTQANGKGIGASVAAIIANIYAVSNPATVTQARIAAEGSISPRKSEGANLGPAEGDRCRRIAEGERAASAIA